MKYLKINKDWFKGFVFDVGVVCEPPQVSICCGAERSIIYPRDCWKCGALFVPSPVEKK